MEKCVVGGWGRRIHKNASDFGSKSHRLLLLGLGGGRLTMSRSNSCCFRRLMSVLCCPIRPSNECIHSPIQMMQSIGGWEIIWGRTGRFPSVSIINFNSQPIFAAAAAAEGELGKVPLPLVNNHFGMESEKKDRQKIGRKRTDELKWTTQKRG